MIIVDPKSKTPIYEQIKEQIIYLVGCGAFKPGNRLPSIRALARELSLNVNTVKRAFNDLESDGVTYSLPGRGVFISETAVSNQKVVEDALKEVRRTVSSAHSRGADKEQITALVDEIYGNCRQRNEKE